MLLLYAVCLPFWRVTALYVWLNSFRTFATLKIVQFMFGRLLSWQLIIFKNWSSLYFVLKYYSVCIIAALSGASVCNRSLLSLLYTHSQSVSSFGRALYTQFYFSRFPVDFVVFNNNNNNNYYYYYYYLTTSDKAQIPHM